MSWRLRLGDGAMRAPTQGLPWSYDSFLMQLPRRDQASPR